MSFAVATGGAAPCVVACDRAALGRMHAATTDVPNAAALNVPRDARKVRMTATLVWGVDSSKKLFARLNWGIRGPPFTARICFGAFACSRGAAPNSFRILRTMASFDVIFIGGGPAGYVGAIRCAQLGLSTAVVEREGLGGTCVLWGCIPAKALLESAAIANRLQHAKEFGVTVGDIKLEYGVAMKRSRAVSQQNSKGVEFLFKKNKISWLKGVAKLAGKNAISLKTAEGKEEKHEAKKGIVVSTGSRVKGLPQIGLELNKTTVISSDEALILDDAPKTLAIVGAGAVGCEFADVFNAFGSQVTLIEVLPGILPLEDADCSKELDRAFKKRKIDVLASAKISGVKVGKNSVSMVVEAGGQKKTLDVERVLIAAGRAPNVEEIGLKEQGVQLTERGFIKIDAKMATTAPGIYAIGDVAGPPMLAHKGSREGVTIAEILAGKHTHGVNYGNIPSATYCHPEVASIGLTENQCKEKKLEYKVGRFNFSANGRARTSGETDGFVKIIRDAKYGEILGAHIIGAHATELIHELAVARENEFTVEEVDLAIHAHPTLAEAVAEAALDSMGMMIHA
ncbi:MAG: dihydrolipoyl dehydrogenase [Gemmatimonadetes bacterium]|nr:MAG: dihydrolipoyl dehydrogenase [Gemmatimonadota bacterium]